MDLIVSALGYFSCKEPKKRVDRFFDSNISEYWKAFHLNSRNIWKGVDDKKDYWNPKKIDGMDFRHFQNKTRYYELLTYTSINHAEEFENEKSKLNDAWEWLKENKEDIPENKSLRESIYNGLKIYLEAFRYGPGEEVKVFAEIMKILGGDDPVGFILKNQLEQKHRGELLLSAPTLETKWNTDRRARDEILQAILATMDHSDLQVRKQAEEFLKKHVGALIDMDLSNSPQEKQIVEKFLKKDVQHEIQMQVDSFLKELDSVENDDGAGDKIGKMIEVGSQGVLKAVKNVLSGLLAMRIRPGLND